VRSLQSNGIGALLGEPQGQPELREALLGAAEVGEVRAEHRQRPQLGPVRADGTGERERLLADRP
jgi:hypothetical protein